MSLSRPPKVAPISQEGDSENTHLKHPASLRKRLPLVLGKFPPASNLLTYWVTSVAPVFVNIIGYSVAFFAKMPEHHPKSLQIIQAVEFWMTSAGCVNLLLHGSCLKFGGKLM